MTGQSFIKSHSNYLSKTLRKTKIFLLKVHLMHSGNSYILKFKNPNLAIRIRTRGLNQNSGTKYLFTRLYQVLLLCTQWKWTDTITSHSIRTLSFIPFQRFVVEECRLHLLRLNKTFLLHLQGVSLPPRWDTSTTQIYIDTLWVSIISQTYFTQNIWISN